MFHYRILIIISQNICSKIAWIKIQMFWDFGTKVRRNKWFVGQNLPSLLPTTNILYYSHDLRYTDKYIILNRDYSQQSQPRFINKCVLRTAPNKMNIINYWYQYNSSHILFKEYVNIRYSHSILINHMFWYWKLIAASTVSKPYFRVWAESFLLFFAYCIYLGITN